MARANLTTNQAEQRVALPFNSLDGESLFCVRCEYDLRGVPVESVCPECGLPLMFSTARYTLRILDVEWLNRIQFGNKLIWIGGPAALYLGVFSFGLTKVTGDMTGRVYMCILALSILVCTVAFLFQTTRPLTRIVSGRGEKARRTAHFSLPILGVCACIFVLMIGFDYQLDFVQNNWIIIVFCMIVLTIAGIGGLALYLLALCDMFKFVEHRSSINGYLTLFGIGCAVDITFLIIGLMMEAAGQTPDEPLGVMVMLGAVAVCISGALICLSPTYLTKRIKQVRSEAQKAIDEYEARHGKRVVQSAPANPSFGPSAANQAV